MPSSDRYGSMIIAATEQTSEGTVMVEEAGACSSHWEEGPDGEHRSSGYI